jgi:RNA recognition motif-containing protein
MITEIYVAHLPPDADEEDVYHLISRQGTVHKVEMMVNQRTGEPRHAASVELETDQKLWYVLRQLNSRYLGEYRVFASPKQPTQDLRIPPPLLKSYSKEVAEKLGETDFKPRVQIHRMIRLCGVDFVQAVLEETFFTEENGGLMLPDDSRRRTLGGVFFHLARRSLNYKILKPIFFAPLPPEKRKPKPRPHQHHRRPDRDRRSAPRQEAAPPPPPPEKPKPKSAAELLENLRQSYREAQQDMNEYQQQGNQAAALKATQRVYKIGKQIDAILERFPHLK